MASVSSGLASRAGEAVVEGERERADPARAARIELDEPEQAEIVAQLAVDGVVVEEVSEVEEHAGCGAMEDVRRVAGDQRGAGGGERFGGAPDPSDRRAHQDRFPVGHDEDGVGVGPGARRLARPFGQAVVEVRVGDARAVRGGGVGGWMVGEGDEPDAQVAAGQDTRLAGCRLVAASAHAPDARGLQVRERVEKRLGAVVEGVVVGQRDGVDAEFGQALGRDGWGAEEKRGRADRGSGRRGPRCSTRG